MVGQDGLIQKLKMPMLRGFHSCNIPSKTLQRLSQESPWLSKNPPLIAQLGPIILITIRLNSFYDPLIYLRKPGTHLLGLHAEQINHTHTTRRAIALAKSPIEW